MKRYSYIALILGTLLFVISCSKERTEDILRSWVVAPESTIERDVKGHEQIYSVQAILRLAQKRRGGDTYAAYDVGRRIPAIPTFQEIDFSKDADGNITITSERKVFDVVKSQKFYYALELKYFDINGTLINHQFSRYDPEDKEGSTLEQHQHLFTIQSYSLDKHPLVYPMTLDSVYYDKYLLATTADGKPIPSTISSPNNVYLPESKYESNTLRYDLGHALKATEVSLTQEAILPFVDARTKRSYRLYKTIDGTQLNQLVPEIFTYEYRDTDPVEEPLGSLVEGMDDLGRIRVGLPVIRLRKKRSMNPGSPLDALGFKGILQFKQADITFQMRVSICHIITASGKYDRYGNPGGVHRYNDVSTAWNNFDIDYPIPFRVIADVDGDRSKLVKGIQRFYPQASQANIEKMFWDDDYFVHTPRITM